MQLSRPMRPLVLLAALLGAACRPHHPGESAPVRVPRDTARVTQRPPAVGRDTALEQGAARPELKVLEQEAQGDELRSRRDDARAAAVRAPAKLQTLAHR